MKFSLSTNWCSQRLESGREIAEKAIALGFDELELGFNTTALQAQEVAALADRIRVGSIHAFCPVPISAPQGYPELYQLASFDEDMRAIARVHVRKNIEFAASLGADTVVLHAGRVLCGRFFWGGEMARRVKRGAKMVDVFRRELDALAPVLEKHRVTLGLENLPYLAGFPGEWELKDLVGEWVKPWLDTGHDFVRREAGWAEKSGVPFDFLQPVGLHINDSEGGDDHLPPGRGKVDFAALKPWVEKARHLVFEPHEGVSEQELVGGLAHLRALWGGSTGC